MTCCVVDTNIVVYYLNQVGGDDFRRRFDETVKKGAVISVITHIEVVSWSGYADVSPAMAVAEALLSTLREEPLTDAIVQEGGYRLAPKLSDQGARRHRGGHSHCARFAIDDEQHGRLQTRGRVKADGPGFIIVS